MATSIQHDLVSTVENEISCPICFEDFEEPKCLPNCAHNVCQHCLEEMVKTRVNTIECPVCRVESVIPLGGVAAFPKNHLLVRLIEQSPGRKEKQTLEQALKNCKKKLEDTKAALGELEGRYVTTSVQDEKIKERIQCLAEDVVRTVRDHERKLLAEIQSRQDRNKETYESHKSSAAELCEKANGCIQTVQDILENGELSDLKNLKDALLEELNDFSKCLDERKLGVNREFAQPSVVSLTETNSVEKLIEDKCPLGKLNINTGLNVVAASSQDIPTTSGMSALEATPFTPRKNNYSTRTPLAAGSDSQAINEAAISQNIPTTSVMSTWDGWENNRGNDRGNVRWNDRGNDRANDQGNDWGNDWGNDRGNDWGNDRGNDWGNDWGNDQGNDWGNDRGNDWGNDRGNDWGNDRGNDWGNDRGNDWGNDWGNDLRDEWVDAPSTTRRRDHSRCGSLSQTINGFTRGIPDDFNPISVAASRCFGDFVALDDLKNNVYIFDEEGETMNKIHIKFGDLWDIAVTNDEEIVVVNRESNRLLHYDMIGNFQRKFVTDPEDGVRFCSCTVDVHGRFIVTSRPCYEETEDDTISCVLVYTPSGNLSFSFGEDDLRSPKKAVFLNGKFYVTDSSYGNVCMFDKNGIFLASFGDYELESPSGIAADYSSGNLVVTDSKNSTVQVYSQHGEQLKCFETEHAPIQVALHDNYTRLLICCEDDDTRCIQMLTYL